MGIDDKIRNAKLKQQQKYQHFHQVKLIDINILKVKKYQIEEARLTYFSLEMAFEK